MASPGPGYNPEVSLLQGGTAPIVPVQGGGGMEAGAVPAGYKPDVSLLDSHVSAPIVPIKGGGQGSKAYEGYVLESYDPPLEMIAIPELPTSTVRRELVNKYSQLVLPELLEVKSLEKTPEKFQFLDEVAPTYQKCSTETGKRRLPLNFFEVVRRRIVLIDTPEPYIWIVPNLKGNVSRFLQYLKVVPKTSDGRIQSNHFVICTGTFFSTTDMQSNFNLYHQFLSQKLVNPKNLYTLHQLSDDFVTVSCNILRSMYSADTLRAPESQHKPLPTFFEPDILVFIGPQIVFRNSELPVQREDNSVKLSKILTLSRFPVKSFLLVPSKDTIDRIPSDDDTDEPADKRFFFLSFLKTTKEIKTPSPSVLTCAEEKGCQGFRGAYKLVDIGDDRKIETPGMYLLWKNSTQEPFLGGGAASAQPSEPVPPSGPEEPTLPAVPAVPSSVQAKEEPLVFEAEPPAKLSEEPFVADSTAVESKSMLTMDLNGVEYRIRVPFAKEVQTDWSSGKFTDGEASFLNAMQLTPGLLAETFGTKLWKPQLAEFLVSLGRSDCFKDPSLLTKRECSTSQAFVKRIYLAMYNRSLRAIYEGLGMPTPDSLEDILEALKRLGRVGPTVGSERLNKYQFTGDVFNRVANIQFDPETNEYFVDLVQIPEESSKLLDQLKLFRAESKDYQDIVRLLLKEEGIPEPPSSAAPTPAPTPATTSPDEEELYTIQDIQEVPRISQEAFDTVYTEGDGLCFYRAVLKGLLPDPPSDKGSLYVPSEEESLAFVKELKDYLQASKQTLRVKTGGNATEPVETYFNSQFAARPGDQEEISVEDATEQDRRSRIRIGPVYKKMTFADYLEAMDAPDAEKRPYAEVQSAGIGEAAAKLTRTVIVIYVKLGKGFNLVGYFNEDEATQGLPIHRFLFLDHVGGNHYNLLKLKEGVAFPKAMQGGGEDEVFDIGSVQVRSKTRKQKKHLGSLTRRHARHDHGGEK